MAILPGLSDIPGLSSLSGFFGGSNAKPPEGSSDSQSIKSFIGYLNQYTDVARADRFKVYIVPPRGLSSGITGWSGVTEKLSFQCDAAELPGKTISTFENRTYGPQLRFPYQTTYGELNLTFYCMGNPSGQTRGSPSPVTNGLWEKRFFDDWMELINPTEGNGLSPGPLYNINYKDAYISPSLEIWHYDTTGGTSAKTPSGGGLFSDLIGKLTSSAGNDAIGAASGIAGFSGGNFSGLLNGSTQGGQTGGVGNQTTQNTTYKVKFIDAYPISINQLSLSWADESVLKLNVVFAYTKWERTPFVDKVATERSLQGAAVF